MFNFFKKQQPADVSEPFTQSEQSYAQQRLHYETIKTITVAELKKLQEKATYPTDATKQLEILHKQGLSDLKQYIGGMPIHVSNIFPILYKYKLILKHEHGYSSDIVSVTKLIEQFLDYVLQEKLKNLPEIKRYNQWKFILEKVSSRIASGDLVVECVEGESTDAVKGVEV